MALGIGSILGGVGGAVGGLVNLFGSGKDDDAARARAQALEVWKDLQGPSFSNREIVAPELQFISRVDPENYQAALPEEVVQGDTSAIRGNQVSALKALEAISRGDDPAFEMKAAQTQDAIAQELARAQAGAERDLARRGRSGGAATRAAFQALSSGALGDLGRSLAIDQQNQRLAATQALGSLATNARTGDESLSLANAGSANRFNELIAGMETQARRDAAGTNNQFNLRNADERQRLSDANQLLRHETNVGNLERFNELAQRRADFDLNRAAGSAGQLNRNASAFDRENANQQQSIAGLGAGLGGTVGSLFQLFGGGGKKKGS